MGDHNLIYWNIGVLLTVMAIAMAQNSAVAQQPTTTMNIMKAVSAYPFLTVLYHGPTFLVLRGDKFSNNIWAAVGLARLEGVYKIDGMSAYSYQTGVTLTGYTVSEIVIVAMSR